MNYKIEKEVIDKIVDGVEGEETTVYRVYEDGTKEFACSYWKPKETGEPALSPEEQQNAKIDYIMATLT